MALPLAVASTGASGLSVFSVASRRAMPAGSAASTLVTTRRVAASICRRPSGSPRSSAMPCRASTVTTISATTMWWTRMGSARIASTMAAGIGEAAGFQHDAVEAIGRRTVAAALVAEQAQRGDEPVAPDAAAAAAGEHDEAVGAAEKRVVDRRFRGLVDHDHGVGVGAGMKLVAQPGRLAGAEEPAEDGEADAAFRSAGHVRIGPCR
jgi:hypothetical protein